MKKYRHLFFDLDRTLWDFETNSRETLRDLYKEFALYSVIPEFEDFNGSFHIHTEKLWELLKKGFIGKAELRHRRFILTLNHFHIRDNRLAAELNDAYMEICPQKTTLIEGATEILDYLKEKGYCLSILTNGFTLTQQTKLKTCRLDSYFEKIITSEAVKTTKPSIEIFRHALSELKAHKEESLMIGDDWYTDIEGARAAGIDQMWLNPSGTPPASPVTFQVRALREIKEIL